MDASTADAHGTTSAPRRSLRIDGLDVARAVAILGMVGSHTGDEGVRGDEADGWAWLTVTHGYPSALFAVLAGVSMTLMATRRATVPIAEVSPESLHETRVRIAVRAAILVALGWLMMALGTPVAVILGNLGLMFLLALPMLRWRVSTLLGGAAVAALGGGWLARVTSERATEAGVELFPVLGSLWSEHYPALAWMAYIMVGLALGRLNLRSTATAWGLVALGAAVAVVGRAGGAALRDVVQLRADVEQPDGVAPSDGSAAAAIEHWLTAEAHSYTPVEMIGNIGVACAVIGIALPLAARWPRALWVLGSAGSMALTLYVAHLIVIAAVGNEMVWEPSNVSFVALALGLVTFACGWRALVGQGPLERLLTSASTTVAAAAASPARGTPGPDRDA